MRTNYTGMKEEGGEATDLQRRRRYEGGRRRAGICSSGDDGKEGRVVRLGICSSGDELGICSSGSELGICSGGDGMDEGGEGKNGI